MGTYEDAGAMRAYAVQQKAAESDRYIQAPLGLIGK